MGKLFVRPIWSWVGCDHNNDNKYGSGTDDEDNVISGFLRSAHSIADLPPPPPSPPIPTSFSQYGTRAHARTLQGSGLMVWEFMRQGKEASSGGVVGTQCWSGGS